MAWSSGLSFYNSLIHSKGCIERHTVASSPCYSLTLLLITPGSVCEQLLEQRGSQAIPHNFQPTVPAYNPTAQGPKAKGRMPTQSIRNPQVRNCKTTEGWTLTIALML
eukprot:scaffold190073_cov15-Tisochrysis_lutea.AAC.3